MIALALVGAALIGITLGLMGSGGSILTVPVLVYLLGRPAELAIPESLVIVGGIAAIGVIPHAKKGLVNWPIAFWFGAPGMAGAYIGAIIGTHMAGALQLILFAVVMLAAAWFMFHKSEKNSKTHSEPKSKSFWLIMIEGLVVGVLTGIVGVGGGFLIVPALVLLGGLPMHRAIATSLVVIAAKSAVAFLKYQDGLMQADLTVDWKLIGMFVAIGAAGTFVGKAIGGKINQGALKRAFAVFLVLMGVVMIAKESAKLLSSQANQDGELSHEVVQDGQA